MHSPSMRDRTLAIAAGSVFLAGACGVLFEDVILNAAPFVLKHYVALAIMAGTIFAGHLAHTAWRKQSWLASLGFALVFVSGTALIVYLSTGRQAAAQMQTEAQVAEAAEARSAVKRARGRSQQMLDDAQRDLAAECKSGRGRRCDGIRATIEVYEAAVRGHDASLAKLGPTKVAAPEAEQLAELMAVFGFDRAQTKAAALILVPFLVTLFFELGTVVSLGFAFRHGSPDRPTVRQSSDTSRITDFPALDAYDADNVIRFFRPDDRNDRPDDRKDAPRRPSPAPSAPEHTPDDRKQATLQALLTDLALGRTIGSQREACARYGIERSTMSDWLTEWEAAGLIPARRTVGRRKEIAAA